MSIISSLEFRIKQPDPDIKEFFVEERTSGSWVAVTPPFQSLDAARDWLNKRLNPPTPVIFNP